MFSTQLSRKSQLFLCFLLGLAFFVCIIDQLALIICKPIFPTWLCSAHLGDPFAHELTIFDHFKRPHRVTAS